MKRNIGPRHNNQNARKILYQERVKELKKTCKPGTQEYFNKLYEIDREVNRTPYAN